jgi:hypothetical protein
MRKNLKTDCGSFTLIYATKILTVDPGSNAVGTACFNEGKLIQSREIKSHSKSFIRRIDNILVGIMEAYFDKQVDLIVMEFGGNIRMKGRNPHGIRVHDFAAGYIGAGLTDYFQRPIVLIPPEAWKGNLPKRAVVRNMQLVHDRELGEDEAHAINLGEWYIKKVKLYFNHSELKIRKTRKGAVHVAE